MGEMCCEIDASSQRVARRRRMELRRVKIGHAASSSDSENTNKNKRFKKVALVERQEENPEENQDHAVVVSLLMNLECPKFGVSSVCGRRRDMEDSVAVHTSLLAGAHYFSVHDGHGCSHVAIRCKERLHELVREEMESCEDWKVALQKSFVRMDEEVMAYNESGEDVKCRCELRAPQCDAVGTTAVVAILTPDKIIVANCGDSRAVLFRSRFAIPLSSDHKPDRPDELNRIQAAGGRVIYWDGPRVLGVLAMSRAIGDNYLKPFVSCEPEVTVTDRTAEDECLVLASDGLWDVMTNETACGVAKMSLRGVPGHLVDALPQQQQPAIEAATMGSGGGIGEASDNACANASMLLTKLALGRQSADNVSVIVVDLKKDA